MKRREFLKASGAAAGLAVLSPAMLPTQAIVEEIIHPVVEAGPFLELRGSPLRKSCDGLADYNDVSFEEMCEDMVHHRMPEDCQMRWLLGIG